MKLVREDENYCRGKKQLIAKCFDQVIRTNGYAICFVGRIGTFRSECLFGLSAPKALRLIVGGEIGPSTWVGHPKAAFDDPFGKGKSDWFNLGPIAAFILNRGPQWLEHVGEIREHEPGYIEQAATIVALWSTLQRMFASRESISEWQPTFEAFADGAIHAYMRKRAGT